MCKEIVETLIQFGILPLYLTLITSFVCFVFSEVGSHYVVLVGLELTKICLLLASEC